VAWHVRRRSRAPALRQVHSVRPHRRTARQSDVERCGGKRWQSVVRYGCRSHALFRGQVRIPGAALRLEGHPGARGDGRSLRRDLVRHTGTRSISLAKRPTDALQHCRRPQRRCSEGHSAGSHRPHLDRDEHRHEYGRRRPPPAGARRTA
jgi:hypothetical protein